MKRFFSLLFLFSFLLSCLASLSSCEEKESAPKPIVAVGGISQTPVLEHHVSPDEDGEENQESQENEENEENQENQENQENGTENTPNQPNQPNVPNNPNSPNDPEEPNLPSLPKTANGPFICASDFHDGYAFVEKQSQSGTVYCIDRTGTEIFKVENYRANNDDPSAEDLLFSHGFVLIGGNLYDTTGKMTTPESVGVTEFLSLYDRRYDYFSYSSAAMPGGYLLAKKITQTNDGERQELGILNANFAWVVPLSENFYQEFSNACRRMTTDFVGTHVYLGQDENYLDPATGTITSKAPDQLTDVSSIWDAWMTDGVLAYGPSSSDIRQRFEFSPEMTIINATPFCHGKVAFLIMNETTEEYFVTMFTDGGRQLFDPIKVLIAPTAKNPVLQFNGSVLLLTEEPSAFHLEPINVYVIDSTGNILAAKSSSDFHKYDSQNRTRFEFSLGEGAVTLSPYNAEDASSKYSLYLKEDLSLLF